MRYIAVKTFWGRSNPLVHVVPRVLRCVVQPNFVMHVIASVVSVGIASVTFGPNNFSNLYLLTERHINLLLVCVIGLVLTVLNMTRLP